MTVDTLIGGAVKRHTAGGRDDDRLSSCLSFSVFHYGRMAHIRRTHPRRLALIQMVHEDLQDH
jgi:hypothetical protein